MRESGGARFAPPPANVRAPSGGQYRGEIVDQRGRSRVVQRVTFTICGNGDTFVTVKIVVVAVVIGAMVFTSKYGMSGVAAGCNAISQLASLAMVDGRSWAAAEDAPAASRNKRLFRIGLGADRLSEEV
jgi:hypothetical protein